MQRKRASLRSARTHALGLVSRGVVIPVDSPLWRAREVTVATVGDAMLVLPAGREADALEMLRVITRRSA